LRVRMSAFGTKRTYRDDMLCRFRSKADISEQFPAVAPKTAESGRASRTLAVLLHERQVGVGAECNPLRCLPIKFLFAHGRVTSCQRAGRNDGALAHDAAGSDEGPWANARSAEENCSHPDQAPPADVGTMQNRAMADRHTVLDNQSFGRGLCVGYD